MCSTLEACISVLDRIPQLARDTPELQSAQELRDETMWEEEYSKVTLFSLIDLQRSLFMSALVERFSDQRFGANLAPGWCRRFLSELS